MLEQPFYGERRADPADEQPIATVADFMWMGRSAVLEGRVLADYLRRQGYRVGVSGYSMGGNMAGFLAAAMPFPVATALLAAPFSPGPPFLHGILRTTIDWEALGGDTPEVRDRLSEVLHSASVLRFPAPAHTRAAVLVAATRDGYVPTAAAQAIHRHWPGSVLEWVNGGHGTLLWFHRDRLVEAVVRSFERLDGPGALPARSRRRAQSRRRLRREARAHGFSQIGCSRMFSVSRPRPSSRTRSATRTARSPPRRGW